MDIERKRIFLSITAYGIHSRYHKEIERMIEKEFGIKSCYVYEYFMDIPFVRNGREHVLSGCMPFLLRILAEQKFIPHIEENIKDWNDLKLESYTFQNVKRFWCYEGRGAFHTNIENTFIASNVLSVWKRKQGQEFDSGWLKYDRFGIVYGNFKFSLEYLRKDYLREIKKFDRVSYIGLLKEYLVAVYPWLNLDAENLNVAVFSISTEKIFYGEILIVYPDEGELKSEEGLFSKDGREGKISLIIKTLIREMYAPILLLYENYWEENLLKEQIDGKPEWDKFIFLEEELANSNDPLEKSFHILWKERKRIFEELPRKDAKRILEENLVFSRYLVGSPALLGQVKKVAVPRKLKDKEKGALPSFLIIGAPGSGKDDFAKMIPLFFPAYRFGKRYIINMASLKPNALAVPLMSGSDIEIQGLPINREGETSKIKLYGILKRIWENFKKEFPDAKTEEGLREIRKKGMMPTIILDELNSLDIDAQGALLRVLQNKSLQPLGGIDDEKIEFLVIGIVNEPKDVLTLKEPLQVFLKDEKIFGGVLGKAVYEYFRNMRRLREDLYFRLIRSGEIELPSLSDRRSDIPILFTFFILRELPDVPLENLWIDIEVFEELMKESLSWSGNFRELESFAKRTASYALADPENQKVLKEGIKRENFFHIKYEHIEKVIDEFYPHLKKKRLWDTELSIY